MGGDHIARYARHLFVWEDGTRLLDQTQTVVNFSGNSLKLAFKGFAILCRIPSLTHVKISKRKKKLNVHVHLHLRLCLSFQLLL